MAEEREKTKKAMDAIKNKITKAMSSETAVNNIAAELKKLGCLMRKMDILENAEKITMHEADEVIKELNVAVKTYKNSPDLTTIKSFTLKHGGSTRRWAVVSSTTCGKLNPPIITGNLKEKMPAYMLEAITKEKPAHPKYGNLRY